MAVYLDSSAIVKLVVREAESAALRRWLRDHPVRMVSALARVEVLRAVRSQGGRALTRARRVLDRIVVVAIDDDVLEAAAELDVAVARSPDAIHLATAVGLRADLDFVVTYDARMAAAAEVLEIDVAAPR